MRHGKKKHQLNRYTSWHKATMRGISRSIVVDESIHTTLAKAKAAKASVEKMIGLALQNDLAAKRRAFAILQDHELVMKLFDKIGPRFKDIKGGYTRIIGLGRRRGDDAKLVIFELTRVEKKAAKPARKKIAKVSAADEAPEAEVVKGAQDQPGAEKGEHPKEKQHHPVDTHKPPKKFLGGIRKIFKKKSDSL